MMRLGCFLDFYPGLDFRSRFEGFFQSHVCMLSPNLFICSKQISVLSIAYLLVENIDAPSLTYKKKNNSSLIKNLLLFL